MMTTTTMMMKKKTIDVPGPQALHVQTRDASHELLDRTVGRARTETVSKRDLSTLRLLKTGHDPAI
jgi:hypothetical protein